MPCPICFFPGNAETATVCSNCGSALTPAAGAYPGSPVAYEVLPISNPGYPAPPPPPPGSGLPYPPPPVSGIPYPMPVSPTPISVTPISGSPQPGYYPPLKPTAPRSRLLLSLTVIVVVLVIASTVLAVVRLRGGHGSNETAGGGVAASASKKNPTPTPDGTPPQPTGSEPASASPGGDPKAQAAAVDALLDASVASRTKLNAAIDLVGKCSMVDKAVTDMQTVGNERQSQIDSVTRFDLSAIPEGEQVRAMLKEALGFSLAADQSFVPWGQAQQSSGCGGSGQDSYNEALRQSQNASDAKTRFLGVWNPVASRYGLRNRSSNDI